MKKEEIIKQVKELAHEGFITRKELIAAYDEVFEGKNKKSLAHHSRLSAVLYYIGGVIIFLGISIFIGQNWSRLNDISKILVTLGSAIAAYIIGILFSRYEKLDAVSQAFYFIFGLLAPLGLHITFDIASFDIGEASIQSLMAAILFIACFVSYLLLKKVIFLIQSIVFGTWLYFGLTEFMIAGNTYFSTWRVFSYRILTASLTYLFLGYFFDRKDRAALKTLSRWLYGIGVLVFLGSALSLGGWSPNQNIFWELTFPGLAFGTIFLSIALKNRSFLIFGALYLMVYILKVTAEYFTKGLGWPVSLIFAGFVLMGIGYFTFYLNKKYISR